MSYLERRVRRALGESHGRRERIGESRFGRRSLRERNFTIQDLATVRVGMVVFGQEIRNLVSRIDKKPRYSPSAGEAGALIFEGRNGVAKFFFDPLRWFFQTYEGDMRWSVYSTGVRDGYKWFKETEDVEELYSYMVDA